MLLLQLSSSAFIFILSETKKNAAPGLTLDVWIINKDKNVPASINLITKTE